MIEPGLTSASGDEAVALILEPEQLKRRTLGLIRGIWETVYRAEYEAQLPVMREAARLARAVAPRGLALAFADLTGSRVPVPLISGVGDVTCATFCPSAHLGTWVSYILYSPDLIVFFGAPEWIARSHGEAAEPMATAAGGDREGPLTAGELLEGLRALADPTRLQILDLLNGGELYAQELVGRLGIAQSAVSRHLALLERAGLVTVRPRRGMKYYRVAGDRLAAIASAIRRCGDGSSALATGSHDAATVPDTTAA
jgi:DNA-binding transcriptional ArsR family regulator